MNLAKYKTLEALAQAVATLLREEMANNKGWVSSAWQKDPIRFGYSSRKTLAWADTNLSAGSNDVDSAAVASGEIWVITNIMFYYIGTAPTRIAACLYNGSSTIPLWGEETITSNQRYDRQGWWVLEPGDYLRIQVTGATSTDDLYARATGFQVDIDQ